MIRKFDYGAAIIAVVAITSIALFLLDAFDLRKSLLFLLGSGLGIALFHAAFGFTGGWRAFIRERRSEAVRAHILLLLLTSFLFFPLLGGVVPGLHPGAALAPVGYSVLVGAFLFGIGMQLGGGCGSGTLYTMGQGQVDMLVTLIFFIVGATVGSVHLAWWLDLGGIGPVSIIKYSGWQLALVMQAAVLVALYLLVQWIDKRRNQHAPVQDTVVQSSFLGRLIQGPWPYSWGVIALTLFALLTLLIAGHPWSITFAFGLWGTKIWSALGGDISSWSYWGSGYPGEAVQNSVLADVTSVMDFGLILGAMLAAALAGKYAPAMNLTISRVLTAILGGLLLGYGARLAFGCNIGALLAGISTGSLHGWLWMLSAFVGNIVGVQARVILGMDKPWRSQHETAY